MLETQNENKRLELIKKVKSAKFDTFGEISQTSTDILLSPFQTLIKNKGKDLSDFIETMTHWYQENFGDNEFIIAYDEFQKNNGHFRSDEYFFNERLSYFLDYFVFCRQLTINNSHTTTYEAFLNSDFFISADVPSEIRFLFWDFKNFEHGFFEIIKVGKSCVIKNLITNEKYQISNQGEDFFTNFHKGSTFQGFIFKNIKFASISKGIIIHPLEATKLIKKIIQKRKKNNIIDFSDLLFNISKQNTLLNRMKNLTIKAAYCIE